MEAKVKVIIDYLGGFMSFVTSINKLILAGLILATLPSPLQADTQQSGSWWRTVAISVVVSAVVYGLWSWWKSSSKSQPEPKSSETASPSRKNTSSKSASAPSKSGPSSSSATIASDSSTSEQKEQIQVLVAAWFPGPLGKKHKDKNTDPNNKWSVLLALEKNGKEFDAFTGYKQSGETDAQAIGRIVAENTCGLYKQPEIEEAAKEAVAKKYRNSTLWLVPVTRWVRGQALLDALVENAMTTTTKNKNAVWAPVARLAQGKQIIQDRHMVNPDLLIKLNNNHIMTILGPDGKCIPLKAEPSPTPKQGPDLISSGRKQKTGSYYDRIQEIIGKSLHQIPDWDDQQKTTDKAHETYSHCARASEYVMELLTGTPKETILKRVDELETGWPRAHMAHMEGNKATNTTTEFWGTFGDFIKQNPSKDYVSPVAQQLFMGTGDKHLAFHICIGYSAHVFGIERNKTKWRIYQAFYKLFTLCEWLDLNPWRSGIVPEFHTKLFETHGGGKELTKNSEIAEFIQGQVDDIAPHITVHGSSVYDSHSLPFYIRVFNVKDEWNN